MKVSIGSFSIETAGKKAAGTDLITHIPAPGWWPVLRESFAGAWQRGILQSVDDALTHPTYWSCVTLIAGDVAKIRPMHVRESDDGIGEEISGSPLGKVLGRPNHYQNRIQFFTYWMLSKLTRGNAYALKERDRRGVITALYLLDPTRVRPMVSPRGEVFYSCQQDLLAGLTDASIAIPASEIVHDVGFAPYHPLCGFSPVFACGHPALQATTIMRNATRLFRMGSTVGGVLTAPGHISDDTAKRLEEYWEANYAGERNVGKVAVLGDGLKFEKPDTMSAVDSQLIETLKWDDEKICAVHHVPAYMIGVGPLPSYNNVDALTQQYYSQCLQLHFESIELVLTEGLELPDGDEVEFDVEQLDRLDSLQKMEIVTKGVQGGVLRPNEGRRRFRYGPVAGGDKVYLQKQCWPLEKLGSDAGPAGPSVAVHLPPTAPGQPSPPAVPPPEPAKALDGDALLGLVLRKLEIAA